MYNYLKENPCDKNYPYIIRDGWNGECHMTKEGLEKLLKEIEKALDKPTNSCYNEYDK